jgi:ankyrin repeat protein
MADRSPPGSNIRKLWAMGIPYTEYSLSKCVDNNNIKAVELFVDEGMIIDNSILKMAATKGNPQIFNLLLSKGANISIKTAGEARDILYAAVKEGHAEIVGILLSRMTTISKRDGGQVLGYAANKGNLEIVKALVDWGADLEIAHKGKTPLLHSYSPEIISYLLEKGANVNTKDKAGQNSLMLQVGSKKNINATEWQKRIKIAKMLINHGVDINDRNLAGKTAIDIARSYDNREIEELLKEAGAKATFNEENFLIAVDRNEIENVKFSLTEGIDANAKNHKNKTALIIAVETKSPEMVGLLLEHGADVNTIFGRRGKTLLMNVVGNVEIVKLLLKHGADLNAKDKSGKTALMEAVKSEAVATVKLLLKTGADVHIKENKLDRTALLIAAFGRNVEILKLLLSYGADVNTRNSEGGTALMYAAYSDSAEKL